MAYQYRGDIHDVEELDTPRVSGHGTYAGYRRHQSEGSVACQDCKDAQATYSREYYEKRGGRTRHARKAPEDRLKMGRKPIHGTGCGTPAGAQQHYRAGTPVCDACRQAMSEYRRNRKRVAA
jgi:hypothetical protein